MGIQGSDGARARRAVREVRACITAHTPDAERAESSGDRAPAVTPSPPWTT